MNKSFEHCSGMSYVNKINKENAWDKMRKGLRCCPGWGKIREERNNSRFANSPADIDNSLRSIEKTVEEYKRAVEESIRNRTPRPIIDTHDLLNKLRYLSLSIDSMDPGQKHRLITLESQIRKL